MRLVVSSHYAFGLGNVHLMLAICQYLLTKIPKVFILVLSGSPAIHNFAISERLDYLKLPCLTSDRWKLASLEHFAQKWDVTQKDKSFKKFYDSLGHHRHQALVRPLVKQLSFGGYATWLEKTLVALERKVNSYISDRFTVETQETSILS